MRFKIYFVVIWASATVLLSALVDWRITVPLNNQGLIMIKDEANVWQRILFSGLIGGVYSAANIGLFALLEKYSSRRKAIP
jgi:hypothetical protein